MNPSNLRQINDDKAAKLKAEQQHQDMLRGYVNVSNTVIDATTSLIKYLEGHTSKVHVINQLNSIGTPDAFRVVAAVNQLHDTIKTHENTDLSEVTKVMQGILDEAKLIPKELPEQKEAKVIDYTKQFKALEAATKAVEKVVKAQKLIAEAPVVNVAPADVKVDAPDLKPLQTSIKAVVTAVNKIVIPEYKTDNKAVEELLKKSNKLLKEIVEKPVGGGGGGGRVSPYQTGVNAPAFVTLEADGSIPVTISGGGGSGTGYVVLAGSDVNQKDDTFYGEGVTTGIAATAKRNWNGTSYDRDWGQTQTKAYSVSAVSDDGTYKYFFFEDASLNYYIMRKHKTNKVFDYTKGTGGYAAVYQSAILGPSGSPTFASYGNTF